MNGGGGRTRTSDTGLMRPLLCHLSYAAVLRARAENLQAYRAGVKRADAPSDATLPEIRARYLARDLLEVRSASASPTLGTRLLETARQAPGF